MRFLPVDQVFGLNLFRMSSSAPTSIIPIGTQCYYSDARSGTRLVAKIVKVHYDDLPAYYTIKIDGHEGERETVRSKLSPVDGVSMPSAVAASEGEMDDVTALFAAAQITLDDGSFGEGAARVFREIDIDGDGAITCNELERWTRAKGQDPELARRLFSIIDKDGDKLIDYPEFKEAHRAACAERMSDTTMETLRTVFAAAGDPDSLFDAVDEMGDKDGGITRRELAAYLVHSGGNASDAAALLSIMDGDKDGLIDRHEMRAAYRKIMGNQEPAPSPPVPVKESQVGYTAGQLVILHGLARRVELNGMTGTVEGIAVDGRINVRLGPPHGTLLALKSRNLMDARSTPPAPSAPRMVSPPEPRAATNSGQLFQATVPPGYQGSMPLQVRVGEAYYWVNIPPGLAPGMTFQFSI